MSTFGILSPSVAVRESPLTYTSNGYSLGFRIEALSRGKELHGKAKSRALK